VDEPDIELESVLRGELVLAAPAEDPAAQGEGAIDLRTLSKASFIIPPRELAPVSTTSSSATAGPPALRRGSRNMRARCERFSSEIP
jgi:hypothetical protein